MWCEIERGSAMEADYDLYGDLEDPFFPVEKESSTNEVAV